MAQRRDTGTTVVRRAPFSDNPRVGARGQRTQQRILDAALRVFAEVGYHRASVDRIATLGGSSRVSFYQYFASKEDVFRHLAEQLARQVSASIEAMDLLTPGVEGWTGLRSWVGRYVEIHERYAPIYHTFETDEGLASVAAGTGEDVIIRIQRRVTTTGLPPRQLDPLIRLLLECMNHTIDVAGTLRSVAPDAYPSDRVERAITDVLHRTLFGLRTGVNVHAADGIAAPGLEFDPAVLRALQHPDDGSAAANRAYAALLTSAREVFTRRGYHGTRIDDLVAAAGVSHGAFYRYFTNKDELAQILVARAMGSVAEALSEIPSVSALDGSTGRSALQRWLRSYNTTHVKEAAMLGVWVDASLQDPTLRAASAPPLEWGRRRMSRYLQPRGFGDAEMEAVVMVALLGVFGARQRSAAAIDAASRIIERGLLGR